MKNVYLNSLIKREKRKKYAIGLCTDMVMRVGVYMWRCNGKKAKRIICMVCARIFDYSCCDAAQRLSACRKMINLAAHRQRAVRAPEGSTAGFGVAWFL